MSSSRPRLLQAVLTGVALVALVLMVYLNVYAMSHNVADELGYGGLLLALERSTSPASEGGADAGASAGADLELEEGDAAGLQELESAATALEGVARQLERRLHTLAGGLYDAGVTTVINHGDDGAGERGTASQEERMAEKILEEERRRERTREWREREQQPKQQRRRPPKNLTVADPSTLTGLNILLLYADDWAHHTLSSFHKVKPVNTLLQTPVLDALAGDGIRFTHNCVTTSVCWISRATLYTGQYMSRHKTKEPCCWGGGTKPKQKLPFPPEDWEELSFYEHLHANGYHVGHAGKWGVYLPFDKNLHFNIEEDGWHYRKLGNKVWHITEKNEADALRFLATRPKDKPFFLNVAFFATHARDSDVNQYFPQNRSMHLYEDDVVPLPATGTEEAWRRMPYFFNEENEGRNRWRWRYDTYAKRQRMMKNYYRMATEVDTAIGAILEELRRQDALDNTVVLFTTDNGNFHSEHGLADKWFPHQESIRVPLIIHDPRMKDEQRGTEINALTLNVDLAPTILGFAGLPKPEPMMGRNMAPLYLGGDGAGARGGQVSWRKEFFYEHPIIGNQRYIPASEALVRRDYKYMYWPNYGFEQLFNLVHDPGEMEDIINSTDPEIVAIKKDMKKRFEQLKGLVKSDGVVTV